MDTSVTQNLTVRFVTGKGIDLPKPTVAESAQIIDHLVEKLRPNFKYLKFETLSSKPFYPLGNGKVTFPDSWKDNELKTRLLFVINQGARHFFLTRSGQWVVVYLRHENNGREFWDPIADVCEWLPREGGMAELLSREGIDYLHDAVRIMYGLQWAYDTALKSMNERRDILAKDRDYIMECTDKYRSLAFEPLV